ncbi:MAG TPA: hypothetical protein DEA62_00375 [Coxiellaceae bacterium]|nr:MAG: hypothetical protein A2V89_03940 [Gammaproteobacteria bacterium RBG_16_37_9]HBC71760.1 hypothetical protein [Coxiellaceae bacterium]HBS51442.1 hypothetical protein [Coxiellaceae bacterium]HBY55487.1 hypothetical protein [Coxiellaceae bacterium]
MTPLLGKSLKTKEQEIHDAIESVCTAETIEKSVRIFRDYQTLLHGCRFIFAANVGPTTNLPFNHNFSKMAAIRCLFKTNKILVLDGAILTEMDNGGATFSIDYSISLDSQALRYLKSYIQKKGVKS